jgi:hypothetical protein
MPDAINAPVVVADSSHYAQTKAKMTMPCYEDTFNMRPAVSVVLLVEQSLWDRYLAQHKTESKP